MAVTVPDVGACSGQLTKPLASAIGWPLSTLSPTATQGSARALHVDDRIGNLAAGMEADFVVLDLASTPAIAQRVAEAESLWEVLFPTIMMGDDRAIRSTWVAGRQAR